MATSRLVQNIGKDVNGTSIDDAFVSDRRQVEVFVAGAAIAVGDWVIFDTSATGSSKAITVIKVPADTAAPLVGCALEAATAAGDAIKVVVRGYHATAYVGVSLTAGVALAATAATHAAGQAVTYSQATVTVPPCGILLTSTDGSTTSAPVYVSGVF